METRNNSNRRVLRPRTTAFILTGAAVLTLGLAILSESAKAESDFAKRHPRRAEVLRRDRNEIRANNRAAAQGKITKGQAAKLDREDAAIRRQEQADAAANGGHITKAEQRDLNREENRVSRRIYNIKHDRNGHP